MWHSSKKRKKFGSLNDWYFGIWWKCYIFFVTDHSHQCFSEYTLYSKISEFLFPRQLSQFYWKQVALLQLRPSQAAASWVFSLFTPGLRLLCACAPSPLAAGSRLFLPQGRNTQQAGFSGKPGHSPSYVLHLLTGKLGEKNFGPPFLDQQTKYASPQVCTSNMSLALFDQVMWWNWQAIPSSYNERSFYYPAYNT